MKDKQAFAIRGSMVFSMMAGFIAWLIREVGQGEGLWTLWVYVFFPAWCLFVGLDVWRERHKASQAVDR